MVQNLCSGVIYREIYHSKAELIGFNMMYKILKLDEDKWTKFGFIHYYPGNFSLFLIFYWTIWGCYLNCSKGNYLPAPLFVLGPYLSY